MEDVCRNFSAKINNLFASSKLEILIGDKSGIIKFPWESSYIVYFGVDSSRRLYICSLYISIIVIVNRDLIKYGIPPWVGE